MPSRPGHDLGDSLRSIAESVPPGGVTATTDRADGKDIEALFGPVVSERGCSGLSKTAPWPTCAASRSARRSILMPCLLGWVMPLWAVCGGERFSADLLVLWGHDDGQVHGRGMDGTGDMIGASGHPGG